MNRLLGKQFSDVPLGQRPNLCSRIDVAGVEQSDELELWGMKKQFE